MGEWQCSGCGRSMPFAPLKGQSCGCKLGGTPRPVMNPITVLTRDAAGGVLLFQCPVCKTVGIGIEGYVTLCSEEHELEEASK